MIKIDLKKARLAQIKISNKAIDYDMLKFPPMYVGGVDVAFKSGYCIGAAVIIDFNSLDVLERKYYIAKIKVPYIPTYLAFREIHAMIGAVKRLELKPDVILVDAHGRMHPRRAGEATHLGVVLNIPTIGVAKSRLIGKERSDGYIVDGDEVIGYRLGANVYISVGHRVSLETAIKIVKKTMVYNIPEPTRQAHIYANEIRNNLEKFLTSCRKPDLSSYI